MRYKLGLYWAKLSSSWDWTILQFNSLSRPTFSSTYLKSTLDSCVTYRMHFFFLLLRLLKFLSIHDYFQLILKIYLFLSFLTEIFLPGFHFSFVPFLSKSVFFLCFYFKILYSFVQIICNFIFYLDCAP